MRNFEVSSVADLGEAINFILKGEYINLEAVSDLKYKIKLEGGRYRDYNTKYINADIAKIIYNYQEEYNDFLYALYKKFGVLIPKEERRLLFELESGSLEITTSISKETINAILKKLHRRDVTIILLALIIGWFTADITKALSDRDIKIAEMEQETKRRKTESDERIKTEETRAKEAETNQALIDLLHDIISNPHRYKEFTIPIENLKKTISTTLKQDEHAAINKEESPLNTTTEIVSYTECKNNTEEEIELKGLITSYKSYKNRIYDGLCYIEEYRCYFMNSYSLSSDKKMLIIEKINSNQDIKIRGKIIKHFFPELKELIITDVIE